MFLNVATRIFLIILAALIILLLDSTEQLGGGSVLDINSGMIIAHEVVGSWKAKSLRENVGYKKEVKWRGKGVFVELVEEELSKETEKECISLWKYGKESFKREEGWRTDQNNPSKADIYWEHPVIKTLCWVQSVNKPRDFGFRGHILNYYADCSFKKVHCKDKKWDFVAPKEGMVAKGFLFVCMFCFLRYYGSLPRPIVATSQRVLCVHGINC